MDEGYSSWAARWRVPLGFALGAAYLLLAQPTARLLAIGAAIAGVGLLWRGWAAGHLDKNQGVATSGPFAYTRHPLYLGSFLIGSGFALAGGSWLIGLAFLAFFVLLYWPVMRREESFLSWRFGEVYARYAAAVPFFFPRWRGATGRQKFDWARYRRNREYEAALGYLGAIVFLALKLWLK